MSRLSSLFVFVGILTLVTVAHDSYAQWVRMPWAESDPCKSIAAEGSTVIIQMYDSYNSSLFTSVSTNRGVNWTVLRSDEGSSKFGSFRSIIGPYCFVGYQRTSDLGHSWQVPTFDGVLDTNTINHDYQLGSFAMCKGNLFAADGQIYRSTDTGLTWHRVSPPSSWEPRLFSANGELFVCMTNPPDASTLWLSSDLGKHWSQRPAWSKIAKESDLRMYALLAVGTAMFAACDSGVYRSSDSGTSWTRIWTSKMPRPHDLVTSGGALFAAVNKYSVTGPLVGGGMMYCNDPFDSVPKWTFVNAGLYDTTAPLQDISGDMLAIGDQMIYGSLYEGLDGAWRRPLSDFRIRSGISSPLTIDRTFTCFPNPVSASTTFRFVSDLGGVADMRVFNSTGIEVAQLLLRSVSPGENQLQWNSGGLPHGLYECVLKLNGQTLILRFALQ